ncbi:hypothetical protein DY000_02053564 [Brassica cretica]|uniref:Uncharacterized protein n=1 Tax=Brassica cretica TaxID=69181 RepID=A0ABQ7AGW9_BRACR|nr:hypothetical protein DY000_02053564 [Brassica cretica]
MKKKWNADADASCVLCNNPFETRNHLYLNAVTRKKFRTVFLVQTIRHPGTARDNGKEDIVDEVVGERESQTEVALATLNAEMHKNMSKMAKAVADAAGKSAAAMTKPVSIKETKEKENGEEERRKELMTKMAKE